jgi:hypothetical protein
MRSSTMRTGRQASVNARIVPVCLILIGSFAACGREPAQRGPDASQAPAREPTAARGGGDSTPPPQAPEPPPPPAAYKTVENALTKAGLKVCSFTGYGENQDYAYLESRHYYVSRDACLANRPPVEGNPRFGTVRVEIYLNRGTLERGAKTHENETRYERPLSGAVWIIDEALVEVPQYLHPAMAQAVDRAMRGIAAKRRYFRFR